MTTAKPTSEQQLEALLQGTKHHSSPEHAKARGPVREPEGIRSAAQYLRMSTEHQQYSLANQSAAIRAYAREHGLEIVRTYSDAARSGVTLKGRTALATLLQDVVTGSCGYEVILIYDVSRWGRFQDNDEAACYEFLCRRSGIDVQYCAEPFTNDKSPASSILKSLKRVMAAEYSRELGIQIFQAKARIAKLGFWAAGRTPFGMRRMIVAEDANRTRVLEPGEHKNLRCDRIILVPGPSKEVECIRTIFHLALRRGLSCGRIAHELNQRGFTHAGRKWIGNSVRNVLTNLAYAGVNVWNRTSRKLHGPTIPLSPKHWITKHKAFHPIIDLRSFKRIQLILERRTSDRKWPDERIVERTRKLLAEKGRLSVNLLEDTPGLPSSRTIRAHFGSYRRLYQAVGYRPGKRIFAAAEATRCTMDLRECLISHLQGAFPDHITVLRRSRGRRPILSLDNEFQVSLLICPALRTASGDIRWRLIPIEAERENPTLVCRLNASNDRFHSFYVFPRIDLSTYHRLKESDPWLEDGCRLASLSQFYESVVSMRDRSANPS